MKDIILASASPRRRELLAQIGIPHRIVVSLLEEKVEEEEPWELVQKLAAQKAEDVADKLKICDKPVLGADTVVVWGNEILGKPVNRDAAAVMLRKLQGSTHQVYTGVAISYWNKEKIRTNTFYEITHVRVYPMTEEEIQAYIATGESDDKAGAYGIQGSFAAFIEGIEGDYYNVVGLPIGRVYQELKKELR